MADNFQPKFLRVTNPAMYNYYIENSLINEVSYTKYLGVIIDHKLSWNKRIQRIVNKAAQVSAFLYQNLGHFPIFY